MSHPFSTSMRSLLLATLVLTLSLASVSLAHAEGFGEITRFGKPAEAGAPGNGLLAVSGNHLLGVDSADNSVYVLEEPKEQEEITSGKQKGEYKRFFRVQEFSSAGAFVKQSKTFEAVTNEDEAEENGQDVQGIAIDPTAERLYFLVNEHRSVAPDEEVETAGSLYALSTKTLEGVAGTTEGVLAGPTALATESKEAGKPLLEPRGITVDPSKHEVVILANIDVGKEKEYHWGLERITSAGALGERYLDSTDFLKQITEAKVNGEPTSPTSTSAGQILVEDESRGHSVGIAKIPTNFEEATTKKTPPTWLESEPLPLKAPFRAAEALGGENEYGGGLSVSPEGTLYQMAEIENFSAKLTKQGTLLRNASDGSVQGWTGGQAQVGHSNDDCVIQPGTNGEPTPVIAAGKEGRFFVLASEFLEKASGVNEEPFTHEAVIEFGPTGKGCPTDSAEGIVANEEGKEVSEPTAGHEALISVRLLQAGALSLTWTIENLETKAKEEAHVVEGRFEEVAFKHKFAQGGEYKVTEKIETDDLAGPQTIEKTRTFKVKGAGVGPVITEQPASQEAKAGTEATFKAAASGTPTPAPEWLVSTDGGTTFVPDTVDSGHNTTTLKVAATVAKDKSQYEAVFKNASGEATTKPATLTVTTEEPKVTTQPANVTVTAGQTAVFSTAASGAPAPTVQWEEQASGSSSWSPIAGATGYTLTLTGTTVAQNGRHYRAIFTNEVKAGEKKTATSTSATLTVNNPPPPPEEKVESKPEEKHEEKHAVLPSKTVAPTATIAASLFTVNGSGAFSIKVSCPAGATTCIGSVVLRTLSAVSASRAGAAKSKKAILTLATGSFSVAGGQSKTITLHLSAKARTLLAHLHLLRAKATVSAHDPAGEQETTVKVLTLKPAKKKH